MRCIDVGRAGRTHSQAMIYSGSRLPTISIFTRSSFGWQMILVVVLFLSLLLLTATAVAAAAAGIVWM